MNPAKLFFPDVRAQTVDPMQTPRNTSSFNPHQDFFHSNQRIQAERPNRIDAFIIEPESENEIENIDPRVAEFLKSLPILAQQSAKEFQKSLDKAKPILGTLIRDHFPVLLKTLPELRLKELLSSDVGKGYMRPLEEAMAANVIDSDTIWRFYRVNIDPNTPGPLLYKLVRMLMSIPYGDTVMAPRALRFFLDMGRLKFAVDAIELAPYKSTARTLSKDEMCKILAYEENGRPFIDTYSLIHRYLLEALLDDNREPDVQRLLSLKDKNGRTPIEMNPMYISMELLIRLDKTFVKSLLEKPYGNTTVGQYMLKRYSSRNTWHGNWSVSLLNKWGVN